MYDFYKIEVCIERDLDIVSIAWWARMGKGAILEASQEGNLRGDKLA